MLSLMKNKKIVVILLCLFSFIVGIYKNFSPLLSYTTEEFDVIMENSGPDMIRVILFGSLFASIVSLICYFIGTKINSNLNFSFKKMDKKGIALMLCASLFVPVLILLFDTYFRFPGINVFLSWQIGLIDTTSTILYNAVLEEFWLRYCLLSLLIFAMHYVFNKESNEVDKKYYTVGIVFLSAIMFLSQFNILLDAYNFNFPLLLRAILVSLLPNLLYGKIYTEYGLKYSMIAHSVYFVMTIFVLPLMLNLILGI